MWLFRRKRKDVPTPVPVHGVYGQELPPHARDDGVPPFAPAPPVHPNFAGAAASSDAYQAAYAHFTGQIPRTSQEQQTTNKRRWFSWKFRLLVGGPLCLAAVGSLVFGVVLIYYTMMYPDPLRLQHKERAPVIRILARDGSVLAQRGAAHDYMPLIMLPRHVTDAVIATEDRRFYTHWGVDPAGLLRAVFANLRAGRFVQGGSTLTQQLAKNLFLSRERTLSRKLEEFTLAVWLEVRLSKQDILELYLNRVYFGAGAYGIEAASQRYFDKSARALTIAEAAVIAGLLKAPSRYSPLSSPTAARRRGRSVLRKMLEAKVISKTQYDKAMQRPMRFAKHKPNNRQSSAAYAVDYVLARMPALIAGNHREIVVETTLDGDIQKTAQDVVETVLAGKAKAMHANQAALVLMDSDGAVRAMVGGRSYAQSQFNRAVKARRQPGSAFKPFVYLSALESGMTPDSTTYDLPVKVKGWAPRNGNGTYQGAVSLRYALAKSINTVAVRLNLELGASRVAKTARRLGIQSKLRQEPSLALGTSEVSLLELTGAYSVFANGGYKVEPFTIRRVRTNSGRVLYARAGGEPVSVVAAQYVGSMNDMLNAALVTGTGRRAGLPNHPAAGKTGTSQQFRDAWFVGYSAHHTAGVWIGNDNGRTMDRVMGGNLPAEIWRTVMMAAHKGKAPLPLPGTLRAPRQVSAKIRHAPQIYRAPAPGNPDTVRLPWHAKQITPVSNVRKLHTRTARPRQRQAPVREKLPWRNEARRQENVKHHGDKPSSISEEFVARALAGISGPGVVTGSPAPQARRAPSQRGLFDPRYRTKKGGKDKDIDAIAAQIEALDKEASDGVQIAGQPKPVVRRPEGMMTLGHDAR
ncbi:MAG: transglycosylase domain-containing protein [Hyphomicrobiaceae bacterium]